MPEILQLFVSTQGNDSHSGTQPVPGGTDGPFHTLERARQAVRAVHKNGDAYAGVEITILPGTYYLENTLVFGPEDSGSERCPVTYKAQGEVVVSGGMPLEGTWTPWPENPGIWVMDVPRAREKGWKFRSLFADGRREILARYPNYIEDDADGNGFLYVCPDARSLLSGLTQEGDWLEYQVDTVAGDFSIWLGCATREAEAGACLTLEIDGEAFTLPPLNTTADYRSVNYTRIADSISLSAGRHTVRIAHHLSEGECPVHLDTIVFAGDGFVPSAEMRCGEIDMQTASIIVCADDRCRTGGYTKRALGRHPMNIQPPDTHTIQTTRGGIKKSWQSDPEAMVDIVVELHYMDEMLYIDEIDEVAGIMRVKGDEAKHLISPSNYFFVDGIFEELDAAREFYLDSLAGRLYYMPEEGVDPNGLLFVAPRLEMILHLDGDDGSENGGPDRVQWLNFEGITFMHAAQTVGHLAIRTPTDGAVKLTNAWHNTFRDCRFENVDGFCVWLHLDSCGNTVERCEMQGMGSGGILLTSHLLGYGEIYDYRPGVRNLAPLRNRFLRNHIHHGNQVRFNGAGILMDSRPASTATMPGNIIAYNRIHDMKRQGIFGFMNQGGNIIAHNDFYDLMTETADGGAINIAAINNVTSPNIVLHNRVDNVIGLHRVGKGIRGYFGGMGIYPDWATSHFYCVDNVVTRTGFSSYINNGGQCNFLCNNIFADDRLAIIHQSEQFTFCCRDNVYERNVFAFPKAAENAQSFYQPNAMTWRDCYRAEIYAKFAENPRYYLKCNHNAYLASDEKQSFMGMSFEAWREREQDLDSVLLPYPGGDAYEAAAAQAARIPGFAAIDTCFGPEHPEDNRLDFGLVTVQCIDVDRIADLSMVHELVVQPPAEHTGTYMVYADRTADARLEVEIHHAEGIERFRMADIMLTSASYFWKHYLGCFRFAPGQCKIIIRRGDLNAPIPNEFVLLERSGFIDTIFKQRGW